ncbi:MAG: MotA/TolQ/ExbB proton channel family protein [Elusimicrobia bacterium]|nr:MotA/TolQ/ExbB proton channel family protein [Elusimicrobiota bacterium]
MPEINYLEILKTSFTLVILVFCSILSLTFTLERWLYFRRIRTDTENFLQRIRQLLEHNQMTEALALCDKVEGPISVVAKTALLNRQKSKGEVLDLLGAVRLEERVKMERFLGILGTLGNTAPFIGLFGTVVGIIKAFHDLALSGSGGPAVVAAGIAEALVATAAGLAVAIPAVIVYNYFMRKVKVISVAMEAASMRLLAYLKMA